MAPYSFRWGGLLTTSVCSPRDGQGKPVPNVSFQLFLIGTKTPPAYFSDRSLTTPRSGSPSTDAFGNVEENWYVRLVDSGAGPGKFDYYYAGQHFGTVLIDPDPGESEDDLTAFEATLATTLANYPTIAQMNAAIASGGGPVVGAELQANKNADNGYAGLNGSGIVADAQLPTTLERTTNKNAANGYVGADSGGKVANSSIHVGVLVGTHVVLKSVDYTAVAGDFILVDTTSAVRTISLPAPVADQPPISVKFYTGAANATQITGAIEGSTQTLSVTIPKHTLTFASDGTYWYRIADYIPASILARLDTDNDFGDHIVQNYRNNQASWTGGTLRVGTSSTPDIGWGVGKQLSNAGGCAVTLGRTAKAGDWLVLGQGSSTQDTLSVESGGSAFFVEPDGYSKTAKQNARLYIECIGNSDGNSAGFIVSGYTGP